MDEREEGEISLEDVSSSEETNHNWLKKTKKKEMNKKYDKRVEVDILPQDTVYGKENRQFANELLTPDPKLKTPLEDSKDGLLPISSEEDTEIIGIPGSTEKMLLKLGPKKKRRKKKKKKAGDRMLVMDDLESCVDIVSLPGRITGEDVMSRDRNHYEIHDPVHKKYSPPSGRLYRSPPKHFKPPSSRHSRSPSPRRRSPRRSPPRRSPGSVSDRHLPYKSIRDHSPRRDTSYSTSLLKKVRQSMIEMNSARYKYKETSLKDKLFHKTEYKTEDYLETEVKKEEEEDDEDLDIEQLRRLALETKPKNEKIKDDETKAESEESSSINYNAGDQDEEDLQLRMIALRSAVMKKHLDRKQRGVVPKNKNTDNVGNLFDDDSLDDIINEAYEEIGAVSPRASKTPGELNAEDMDIDSDIEREKENQPYSPTDDLTDDEYPEVEIINEPVNGLPYPNPAQLSTEIINNTLPAFNQEYWTPNTEISPQIPFLSSDPVILYFPDPTQAPTDDRFLRLDQLNYSASYLKPMAPGVASANSRAETPYSPTDIPVYDPELPTCPSELAFIGSSINNSSIPHPAVSLLPPEMPAQINNVPNLIPISHSIRDPRRAAVLSRQSEINVNQPSVYPTAPIVPEQTADNPQQPQPKKPEPVNKPADCGANNGDEMFDEILKSLEEFVEEPLYMKGVPGVTKDAEKIPTLVNRTLVPMPVLKTNKELQHKLNAKKVSPVVEKTFKNAEMQPVDASNASMPLNSNSAFKSIKLQSNTRKIQLITVPTKVFNNAEDSGAEADNSKDLNQMDSVPKEVEPKKRGRPKTPTMRKPVEKKTPTKENDNKRLSNVTNKPKSTRGPGRPRSLRIDDKEDKSNKSTHESDELKQIPIRTKRSRSSHSSESSGSVESKRESLSRAAKAKPKASETNSKENEVAEDGRKRRSSVDEDEEALRASLLESLLKRTKTVDDSEKKAVDPKGNQVKITILNEKSNVSLTNNSQLLNNPTAVKMMLNDKLKSLTAKASANAASLANRKRTLADAKGPPEKILKKALAKNDTYTVVNPDALKLKKKVNVHDAASTKMSKKLQKLVINLGEDTDSDSESFAPALPNPEFEQRVTEFLKYQRHFIEKQDVSKPPATPSGSKASVGSLHTSTPLAVVRLLPASKQKEYRRLKQVIAQKEKRKLLQATEKAAPNTTKTAMSASSTQSHAKNAKAPNVDPVTSTLIQQSSTSSSVSANNSTTLPSSSKTEENQLKSMANAHLTNSPLDVLGTNEDPVDQQQSLGPIDFSIKPDPIDTPTIAEECKVDTGIIENVPQAIDGEPICDVPFERLGMRENLIIQIPNIRDDNTKVHRLIRISNDMHHAEQTPTPAVPVLRILTTDQLNMKFEQTQPIEQEMEKKVSLDESVQLIVQDISRVGDDSQLDSQINIKDTKTEPVFSSELNPSVQSSTEFCENVPKSESETPETLESTINIDDSIHEQAQHSRSADNERKEETNSVKSQSSEDIKAETDREIETYIKLPADEQKIELAKIENDLVKERFVVLSDLSDLVEHLRIWEAEQDAQAKLSEKVRRLKSELREAEELLDDRKSKMHNMGPKITKVHSVINDGRRKCTKLEKICEGLGSNVSGNDYKVPNAGDEIMTEKIREVSKHTQRLSKKRTLSSDSNQQSSDSDNKSNKNSISESSSSSMCNADGQQTTPLNLSVQTVSEVQDSSVVKTEDSNNEGSNPSINSMPDQSEASKDEDKNQQTDQNQQTEENVLVTRIKTEPVDTDDNNLNNTFVNCESNVNQDKNSENVPIAQVKIEKQEGIENNETSNASNVNQSSSTESIKKENDQSNQDNASSASVNINNVDIVVKNEQSEEAAVHNKEISNNHDTNPNEEVRNTKNDSSASVNNRDEDNPDMSVVIISENIRVKKESTESLINSKETSEANTSVQIITDHCLIMSDESLVDRGVGAKTKESNAYLQTQPDVNISIESNVNLNRGIESQIPDAPINTGIPNESDSIKIEQTSLRGADPANVNLEEEKQVASGVSYESVLSAFNTTRSLDPNGVLCPYELRGTCNDDSCTYNHLDDKRKM